MRRDTTFQFGLPAFRGAVRYLTLITLGVWITVVLLWAFDRPDAQLLLTIGRLSPERVLHGWVWQFLTYGFVHIDPRHIIFALIGLYFIGSAVQERIGSRAFAELYVFASVLAGIAGFLLSLSGYIGFGTALGAGAAVNAVLMVFYLLHRGSSIFLIPFPFKIPVEWVVIVIGAIEAAYFLLNDFALFYLVHLLGLGAGYVWCRFLWRRATVSGIMQEQLTSMRNSYYRWKRERAKKKFQVYMRKHNQDPKEYFDEYGNFRPPEEGEKKDRGKGGWVN
jgi:membrane associated rhomboid family serine protease